MARNGYNIKGTRWAREWEQIPLLNFEKREENILANIEQKVENLLKDKIEKIGYDLYDVEYTKEGKNYFLRI